MNTTPESAILDARMLRQLAEEHKATCNSPCIVSLYQLKRIAEKIVEPHIRNFTSTNHQDYHAVMSD